jgi:HlyD family secretion protein
MTVRELVVDANGHIVKPEAPAGLNRPDTAPPAPADLKPGQSRKEFEGVFAVRNGRATFVPVKTGIAGEKYFEALEGLKEGDEVIVGPFASVRSLKEGDAVKASSTPATSTAAR